MIPSPPGRVATKRRQKPATPGPGAYDNVRKDRDSVGRHGRGGPRYSFGTSGRFGDAQFLSKAHTTSGASGRAPGPKYDTRTGPGRGERARWEPNAFTFGKPQAAPSRRPRDPNGATPGPGAHLQDPPQRSVQRNAAPSFSFRASVPAPGSLSSRTERRPGPGSVGRWAEPAGPTSKKGSWARAHRDAGSMFVPAGRPASAPAQKGGKIAIPNTEAKAAPRLGRGSGAPVFSLALPESPTVKQKQSRFLSKDHCRAQVGRASPLAMVTHDEGKQLVRRAPEFAFGTAERLTME